MQVQRPTLRWRHGSTSFPHLSKYGTTNTLQKPPTRLLSTPQNLRKQAEGRRRLHQIQRLPSRDTKTHLVTFSSRPTILVPQHINNIHMNYEIYVEGNQAYREGGAGEFPWLGFCEDLRAFNPVALSVCHTSRNVD